MTGSRSILALATYPETAAATRFRVAAMLPYLRARGWTTRFEPFVDDAFFGGFYDSGGAARKAAYLAARSISRLASASRTTGVDAVLIQREAALLGPPYVELILHRFKGIPIIFDFDDAIWELGLSQSRHPIAARALKSPGKCWYTMRRASGVIAGSSYLAERAREVNANVTVVPTVVPSREWTPLSCRFQGEHRVKARPRIGWVGTHTTAHQLELVEPALRRLKSEGHEFEMHVVGAAADFSLGTVDLHTRPWRLEAELEEFREIDIGLAPMRADPVYQGKCAFKQLQYMSVGVPFVSSFIGGARDFVVDGENGLVAETEDDWYRHLKTLLGSQEVRARLARNGRELVEARYCTEVQGPRVAQFVENAFQLPRASADRTPEHG
jgi:glycosyltransferase involved in cell wall biosynthesis